MRIKALKRDDRKNQVVLQFAIWIQNDRAEHWATSYEIARALNVSASTHFRKILDEMVNDGLLVAEYRQQSGRWDARFYMLAPDTYTPPKPRKIAINPGKKNSAQLEMFAW